jgi:RNA polymerase sigma factor for flagellar operon FliA
MLDEAGRRLVEEHHAAATSAAWRYWQKAPKADLAELRGIARLALVEAAERYPRYCAEHGYDPACPDYIAAYLGRRVQGALLDHSRSVDWMTRSQRQRYKRLEAAQLEMPPGAGLAELAAAAGLTEAEAREVLAAGEARPASFHEAATAEEDGTGGAGGVQDPAADVEGAVAVRAILGTATRALRELSRRQQVIIGLRYVANLDPPAIAAVLGVSADEVGELHDIAILTLHEAMINVAEEEGCGCDGGSCGCGAGGR